MAKRAAAASCVQLHLQRNGFKADDLVPQNMYLGILGSVMENKNQIRSEDVWDEVKKKLLNALDTVECDINLDGEAIQSETNSAVHPLSLYAISTGPRLRLLWATLQQLHEEVNSITGINEAIDLDSLLQVISETIQASLQPICVTWLQEELLLENKNLNKDMFVDMFARMKGVDAIVQNIKRLGKEELYADLLFFLRFGFLRTGCLYGRKLIIEHVVDILEDLVITLADGIASLYLELISVDSSMFSEMNSLGLSLCALSTRTLQRLRNEVALKQWMQQNIESVISMYEDRFNLCTLQTHHSEEPNKRQTDILSWWKNFSFQKRSEKYSSVRYVIISDLSLPMKRTKELRALTGWRYYFSLYLELSDILMPLTRIFVAKVRNAISFFLVSLIGRSLGLIYNGIRQALRWK